MSGPDGERCLIEAHKRFDESRGSGRKPAAPAYGEKVSIDIPGCWGECVVCRVTGREWEARINNFKGPDIGVDIQARCSPCKAKYPPKGFGRLLIRPGDKYIAHHKFTLVVGNFPCFAVRGWKYGRDVMRGGKESPYWCEIADNGMGPGWAVPCEDLNPDLRGLDVPPLFWGFCRHKGCFDPGMYVVSHEREMYWFCHDHYPGFDRCLSPTSSSR